MPSWGGVAVCLHGYQRNTVDIDLLIRREDQDRVSESFPLSRADLERGKKAFQTPAGIPIQILLTGERAGKGAEATLPDPGAPQVTQEREGLPVLSLARLIESKLACGEGDPRRTYKDFADVVELIAVNQLDGSFARFLHKSLRDSYRKLVRHAAGGN